MLPRFWRLRMINKTGQTMTYDDGARIAIRSHPWKMVSGSLVYSAGILTETADLDFDAGRSIVNGADVMDDSSVVESDVVDNTSNLYMGVNGIFEVIHDLDAAVGSCDLYLEHSDNNGNWPSDSGTDFNIEKDLILISSLKIDNSGVDKARRKNFAF